MLSLKKIFFILLVISSFAINAQKDTTQIKEAKVKGIIRIESNYYNPLSPAKAAFYSAIFPGMGQVYNKKYWKVPIVWGSIGTATYFYLINNNEYKRYRTAFKLRKAGLQDEFTKDDGSIIISENGLINAQKVLRKNRDLSLLTTIIFYVLQIVEASVNAHLLQFNTNDNLTFSPIILENYIKFNTPKVGLTLKYSF